MTDAQNLADRYSLKVEKQIIKSEQLKVSRMLTQLLELQEEEKLNKKLIDQQEKAITRILSESSLQKFQSQNQGPVPRVVDRLMEEAENRKRRLQEKKRKYRTLQSSQTNNIPRINKKYTTKEKKLPIYQRSRDILKQKQKKLQNLYMEVEFQKQQKNPEDYNPAFQPDLTVSQKFNESRDMRNTFFDFLKDVRKWQNVKQAKIEQKRRIAKIQEVQGLDFTPKINEKTRDILKKTELPVDDMLERMAQFDDKKKQNRERLQQQLQGSHSPHLHSVKKSAKRSPSPPAIDSLDKKEAVDRSYGYIPFLKEVPSVSVFTISETQSQSADRAPPPPPLPRRDYVPYKIEQNDEFERMDYLSPSTSFSRRV